MSRSYVIYEDATGRIISGCEIASLNRVPQGSIPDNPGFSILHGSGDPETQRVEHGKIVPKGKSQIRAETAASRWFKMREKRRHLMDKTQHLASGDYPLPPAEKKALRLKRSKSRKIPQKVKDPAKAHELLKRIWGDDYVE